MSLHRAQGTPPGRHQRLRPLRGRPRGGKQRFASGLGCVRGEPWPHALDGGRGLEPCPRVAGAERAAPVPGRQRPGRREGRPD
eukprot:9994756-Alexandrium_andersonii.AAC.1